MSIDKSLSWEVQEYTAGEYREALMGLYPSIKSTADQQAIDHLDPEWASKEDLFEDEEDSYHVIHACTGDDSIQFTDSTARCRLALAVSESFLKIQISWKDVGISPAWGNFAEDWISHPINYRTTFQGIRELGGGSALWGLESIKMKLLNPCRKQSSLEMDFSSKIRGLAKAASWVNPKWFTYDYHQLSVVLSMTIFDFRSSKEFPFLRKEEGGLDVMPPFGNLDTVRHGLFAYQVGRATRGITALLSESVGIRKSLISPKDSIFCAGAHMAQAGDVRWKSYLAKLDSFKKKGIDPVEFRDWTRSLGGTNIPEDLVAKAIEIDPDHITVGSILSLMRRSNVIMTETDVMIHMSDQRKTRGLLGDKPMKDVLEEERARKENFPKELHTVLDQLVGTGHLSDLTLGKIENLPGLDSREFSNLLAEYYSMVVRANYIGTSFWYTQRALIFKTDDVYEHFSGRGQEALMKSLISDSFGVPRQIRDLRPTEDWGREFEAKSLEWLDAVITKGSAKIVPLPIRSGVDDLRIVNESLMTLKESKSDMIDALITVVITGDLNLQDAVQNVIGKFGSNHIYYLDRREYISICATAKKREGIGLQNLVRRAKKSSSYPFDPKIEFFNIFTGKMSKLPGEVAWKIQGLFNLEIGRTFAINFQYDVPNIERYAKLIRLSKAGNHIEVSVPAGINSTLLESYKDIARYIHLEEFDFLVGPSKHLWAVQKMQKRLADIRHVGRNTTRTMGLQFNPSAQIALIRCLEYDQ